MFYSLQKNTLFFSLMFTSLSFISSSSAHFLDKDPTRAGNINVSPHITCSPVLNSQFNPHIANEIHPHITVSNTSAISIKISDISAQCVQKIKDTMTRENYHLLKNLITTTLWEYRYTIGCGTIVGTYSIMSILLLADYYHYLQDKTLWARWRPECSFECLCSISQKKLTHELLTTINERYYNKNNPTDLAHPLTLFISSIDAEIKTCKRYIASTRAIQQLHLMTIFPTNDKKIQEVNNLLQRALFIKHLFLSWLSDYNIASNRIAVNP